MDSVWYMEIALEEDVLAGGLVGAEGGGLDEGSGLVVLVGLLDQKSDTTLLAGDETDSLFRLSTSYSSLIVFAPGAFVVRTLLAIPPSFYPS
jgi:hypothetical protein